MFCRFAYNLERIAQLSLPWHILGRLGQAGHVRPGYRLVVCLVAVFSAITSSMAQANTLSTVIKACSNHKDAAALDTLLTRGGLKRVAPDAGEQAINWYGIPFETLMVGLTTDPEKQAKRLTRLNRLFDQPAERLAANGKAILSVSPQYETFKNGIYVATNISIGLDAKYDADCIVFVAKSGQLDLVWSELDAAEAPAFDPAWATLRGNTTAQRKGGIALAGQFDQAQFSDTFKKTLKPAGYVIIVNAH